ncbi:hypothetical protein KO361_00075 [Candidatus Woesearchaeota archaeon]|nr:hypothetical protein [Candidatus Woesearchaeota archaeon]
MRAEVKINDFVKFNVEVDGKFYGVKEFEAEYMGNKRKVNNGQFFVKISGQVTYDYQGKFKGNITEYFLELLVKRILKNYYDIKYVDRLYYDLYTLQTLIKEKVYMETASNAY